MVEAGVAQHNALEVEGLQRGRLFHTQVTTATIDNDLVRIVPLDLELEFAQVHQVTQVEDIRHLVQAHAQRFETRKFTDDCIKFTGTVEETQRQLFDALDFVGFERVGLQEVVDEGVHFHPRELGRVRKESLYDLVARRTLAYLEVKLDEAEQVVLEFLKGFCQLNCFKFVSIAHQHLEVYLWHLRC